MWTKEIKLYLKCGKNLGDMTDKCEDAKLKPFLRKACLVLSRFLITTSSAVVF